MISSKVNRRRVVVDFLILAVATVLLPSVPPPSNAIMTNNAILPDVGEIEHAIPTTTTSSSWEGVENPFLDSRGGDQTKNDPNTIFGRLDTTDDAIFYATPRFVEQIDPNAVQLLTDYISNQALVVVPPPGPITTTTTVTTKSGLEVLDLCSSWTSHINPLTATSMKRIVGLGMNRQELEANPVLSEWTVQDLNVTPQLPYKDNSFDVVLCQFSIDYLIRPLEVLKDVGRVLKPGGKVHILFSNRLFLSKAVGLWTGADDIDHAYYVGCYLNFCHGGFGNIVAKDLSTRTGRQHRIVGDPLYVVVAEKPE